MMNNKEIIENFTNDIKLKSIENLDDFRRFAEIIHNFNFDWFKTKNGKGVARFGRKNKVNISEDAEFTIGSICFVGGKFKISFNDRPRVKKIVSTATCILTSDIVNEVERKLNESKTRWPEILNSTPGGRKGYWPKDYGALIESLPIEIFDLTKEDIDVLNRIQGDGNLSKTEKQTQIQARVGQGKFRNDVIARAEGKCEVTGVTDKSLLIASHIHAWSKCETNDERLDCNNGLLLSPSLDKLFDKGYISFDDEGLMLIKPKSVEMLKMLIPNSSENLKLIKKPKADQCRYLKIHRKEHAFPESGLTKNL
jgi:hypothetical protein